MPDFPRQEARIYQLARVMLYGVFSHMADFPHVNAMGIFTRFRDYKTAREKSVKARARSIRATRTKQASFNQLKTVMKQCLKRSQVDTQDHPEKLALIGWSAPPSATPTAPPGPPMNLTAAATDQPGAVKLSWSKPIPATGSPVRNYLIQSRILDQGTWELIRITHQTQTTLTNQPRSGPLEYQIIAANQAGQSPPGNTATVVL